LDMVTLLRNWLKLTIHLQELFVMDVVAELVREIKKCKIKELEKVSTLIRELQVFRDTSDDSIDPELIFFGLATGLEKISDYRIFELRNDIRLNELSTKIKKVQEREGLDDDEYFVRRDPDSPEDYQALIVEFEHRIDEIRIDILSEFDEDELAELFLNNRMQYIKRYYNGWRVLDKDDPDKLKDIDKNEKEELDELGLEGV
jgi:hypothetical protein